VIGEYNSRQASSPDGQKYSSTTGRTHGGRRKISAKPGEPPPRKCENGGWPQMRLGGIHWAGQQSRSSVTLSRPQSSASDRRGN
jgi:hypothetical protein